MSLSKHIKIAKASITRWGKRKLAELVLKIELMRIDARKEKWHD